MHLYPERLVALILEIRKRYDIDRQGACGSCQGLGAPRWEIISCRRDRRSELGAVYEETQPTLGDSLNSTSSATPRFVSRYVEPSDFEATKTTPSANLATAINLIYAISFSETTSQ